MSQKDASARVVYRREGVIARITLSRPDKLNAIDARMIAELHTALDTAEADAQVRAIVLDGEGRAFSAGFDLQAGGGDIDFWRAELRRDFDIILRFWDSPRPTIAAVHGYCLGSAMELAVACDVTVSAAGCRFGAPEVKFGSGIVCLILPWLIGPKHAKALLLTGEDRLDAAAAAAIGLVNEVVEADRLQARAMEIARTIAANDALAVRLTKRAINESMDRMGLRDALIAALEVDAQIESTPTPESTQFNEILRRDGVKAALEWRRKRAD